jgi:hypothetical protein
MAFTTEALAKRPDLLGRDGNRAWEVWDKPDEQLPETVIAFRLLFPTSELAVTPAQRVEADWKRVAFLDAAPRRQNFRRHPLREQARG